MKGETSVVGGSTNRTPESWELNRAERKEMQRKKQEGSPLSLASSLPHPIYIAYVGEMEIFGREVVAAASNNRKNFPFFLFSPHNTPLFLPPFLSCFFAFLRGVCPEKKRLKKKSSFSSPSFSSSSSSSGSAVISLGTALSEGGGFVMSSRREEASFFYLTDRNDFGLGSSARKRDFTPYFSGPVGVQVNVLGTLFSLSSILQSLREHRFAFQSGSEFTKSLQSLLNHLVCLSRSIYGFVEFRTWLCSGGSMDGPSERFTDHGRSELGLYQDSTRFDSGSGCHFC